MPTDQIHRGEIVIRGARTHNLKNVDLTIPPGPAGDCHGRQRFGQVVARLRHHLRRRAAPLCRVAVGLRPPVPRADGEAGRRLASTASARRSPSGRKTASATRARRSARRPRSTTTCACSTRASAGRSAGNCGREVIRETAEVVANRWRSARRDASAGRFRSAGRDGVRSALTPEPDEEEGAGETDGEAQRPRAAPDLPGSGRPMLETHRRASQEGLRPALRRTASRSLDDVDPVTLRIARRSR